MTTRIRCVAFLLVAVVGFAACGGATSYSTSEVIDTFREQTGERLVRDPTLSGASWDLLGIDTDPEYDWGHWSLYVVKDGDPAELLQADDGEPLDGPDENGVYWHYDDDPLTEGWWLYKQYGANVVVRWVGGDARDDSLDERFARTDSALSVLNDG